MCLTAELAGVAEEGTKKTWLHSRMHNVDLRLCHTLDAQLIARINIGSLNEGKYHSAIGSHPPSCTT